MFMLMSLKSIAGVKMHAGVTKDDVAEVVSKSHNKGRSVKGRRSVKRAERHQVRKEIRESF
jgi:hypothetical protein